MTDCYASPPRARAGRRGLHDRRGAGPDAYLCKVRAVGFPAYEKAHRKALVALAAKAFPRLPTEVAAQVVAFAFHVGYY